MAPTYPFVPPEQLGPQSALPSTSLLPLPCSCSSISSQRNDHFNPFVWILILLAALAHGWLQTPGLNLQRFGHYWVRSDGNTAHTSKKVWSVLPPPFYSSSSSFPSLRGLCLGCCFFSLFPTLPPAVRLSVPVTMARSGKATKGFLFERDGRRPNQWKKERRMRAQPIH